MFYISISYPMQGDTIFRLCSHETMRTGIICTHTSLVCEEKLPHLELASLQCALHAPIHAQAQAQAQAQVGGGGVVM